MNRMMHFQSLLWPVLLFISGIIISYYEWIPIILPSARVVLFLILILIFAGAVILFYGISHLKLFYFTGLILFLASGWTITTIYNNHFKENSTALSRSNHPQGQIVAINSYPSMTRIQVKIPAGKPWYPPHYFNINLFQKNESFTKGQFIEVDEPLRPILPSENPYAFPAQRYWKGKNTSHEVFLYDSDKIKLLKDSPLSGASYLRLLVGKKLDRLYTDPAQAGLLKALLLGQKESVSQNDKENFKQAGLLHILAVSGLHVGIITALLFFLLYPLRLIIKSPGWHLLLVLACLWFYAGLTGMNIPVVRATLLMTFYIISHQIDRRIHRWNVYLWAVLLVLVMNPYALFTVSFHLSFGAVASILFFYKALHLRLIPWLGKNYFSGLVAVSLAAQIGILPILLYHFQEISLVSTLSSFLVIPLLFPLLLFVFISLFLPSGWEWLLNKTIEVSKLIIELVTSLSSELAHWDIASQVWVWNSFTLVFLFISLVMAGLYIEFKQREVIPELLSLSFLFLCLAAFSESLNICVKRNTPVVTLLEHPTHPVLDIYYKGYCYTNYESSDQLILFKSRKQFYTKNKILVNEIGEWNQVVQSIKSDYTSSFYRAIPFFGDPSGQFMEWRDFIVTSGQGNEFSKKWKRILGASSGTTAGIPVSAQSGDQ